MSAQAVSTTPLGNSERLGLSVLLSYCVAQFGLSALNTLINTRLLLYYVDTLMLIPAWFGTVMLLGRCWDAFTDPLMGHITDNTRWQMGRRRPFFLVGAPLLGFALWMLFSPPEGLEGRMLFFWLLGFLLLVYTARTIYETPYQALIPDLTKDYDERTRLATYRVTIGNLGDMTGAIAPASLGALFVGAAAMYTSISGAIGVIIVITAFMAFAGTRERTRVSHLKKKKLLPSLKQIFLFPIRNRPAGLLILSYACAVFSTTMPVAVFPLLNRYVFTKTGLEETALAGVVTGMGHANFLDTALLLSYFTGVFLSAPIWNWALKTRDKKHGYMFAFIYLGVCVSGVMLIPRDMGILFALLNIPVGAGALGLWMLPGAIGPDCLEWEELHHGERHEGGFYGIWSFVQKTGAGVAGFITPVLLTAFGYVAQAEQSDSAVFGMRFLYGGTPIIICLVAATLISRYPITREVYMDIRQQLEAKKRTETL